MANSEIATVLATAGQAYARDAAGIVRELAVGDILLEGENVISPLDGGYIELEMIDGSPLFLNNMPEMAMTQDLIATLAASHVEITATEESYEDILKAFEETEVGFGVSNIDALDLRDLLIDEEAEGADLTHYLDVSYDGSDTVIKVSAHGKFEGDSNDASKVDETFTLEGVDLVGGNEMSMVIQNMLDSGQLITD